MDASWPCRHFWQPWQVQWASASNGFDGNRVGARHEGHSNAEEKAPSSAGSEHLQRRHGEVAEVESQAYLPSAVALEVLSRRQRRSPLPRRQERRGHVADGDLLAGRDVGARDQSEFAARPPPVASRSPSTSRRRRRRRYDRPRVG